jgi:hypothetical protein
MSLAEIETKVLHLSEQERRQFAQWFYAHEAEIAGPWTEEEDEDAELSDELKAELMRRLKEIEGNPEILETFDLEAFDRMTKELVDERAQATSARP